MKTLNLLARILFVCFCIMGKALAIAIITNYPAIQFGDSVSNFALAKILSIKYELPFYYCDFPHSTLLDLNERMIDRELLNKLPHVLLNTEEDIRRNKDQNVILYAQLVTKIDHVSQQELLTLKKCLKLKQIPSVTSLPMDLITVAVHIRKGNGGGEIYDGEQSSLQEFNYDPSTVEYLTNYESFAFDWDDYQRENDHLINRSIQKGAVDRQRYWETKFPPNQYYIDQIKKISDILGNIPIFVSICTDDKNPIGLVQRIKEIVNKSNIIFDYKDNRNLSHHERMRCDLYLLSRTDILIRGQSYFSRAAELIGSHKIIIYPLRHIWEHNKLIMNKIIIKGDLNQIKESMQGSN